MIKAYTKYLLSLCILLLSVNGQLNARPHKDGTWYARIKSHQDSKPVGFNSHQHIQIATSISLGHTANVFYDYDEEVEEKSQEQQKKNIGNNCNIFSSTLFYSWQYRLTLLNITQALLFSKHFLNFPPNNLYIVFSVFRI